MVSTEAFNEEVHEAIFRTFEGPARKSQRSNPLLAPFVPELQKFLQSQNGFGCAATKKTASRQTL